MKYVHFSDFEKETVTFKMCCEFFITLDDEILATSYAVPFAFGIVGANPCD